MALTCHEVLLENETMVEGYERVQRCRDHELERHYVPYAPVRQTLFQPMVWVKDDDTYVRAVYSFRGSDMDADPLVR